MLKLAAALAIAATAAGATREMPVGTPTGPAKSCIDLSRIRESRVRNDQVIDFVMNDRKVYRNTLPYACSGLGFEEKFSYATSLDQLCSTDTITVLTSSPGPSGPSCGLGNFQPVALAH